MRWIKKVSVADYVTLTNGLLGFIAITYIIDGKFTVAYTLLFLCILIDGIDGRLARFFKSKHRFGQYIDSFCDSISFCFAPAILLYSSFYDPTKGGALSSLDNAVVVVVPTIFVCLGIMRLARFASGDYKEKNFLGMPTPAAAFLIINLCILFGAGGIISSSSYLVLSLAFVVSLLMISDIPYPKINTSLFLPSAIAVGTVIISSLILLFYGASFVVLILTTSGLLFISAYVIGGPLYVRISEREYVSPEKI